MAFLPLLHTQEEVLGDFIFGGENGNQIQKFHLGWKVDRKGFPTSYLALNFDFRKALKISLKLVLCIEISGAAHREIWPIFHLAAQNFA